MERKNLITAIIGFLIYLFLAPALLFLTAGTTDWPMAWYYSILVLLSSIGSRLIVYKRNPDTLRERAKFTDAEGIKPWDRVLGSTVGLFGPIAMLIVAGLDHRFGWSQTIPQAIQYLAAASIALGYALASWAMVANSFFSAVARIQSDRGQTVVTAGPYQIVRHPGYAGALVGTLAIPLLLNSVWAILPALVSAAALIIRTALEDRMLRDELPGYEEYTQETRQRLIPGIW